MLKQFLEKNIEELKEAVKSCDMEIHQLQEKMEVDQEELQKRVGQIDYRIENFSPIFHSSPEVVWADRLKKNIEDLQTKIDKIGNKKDFLQNKQKEFEEALEYYVSRETNTEL